MGPGLTEDPSRGILREIRRQSDPLRAQHLWDAIRAVRLQKQIPAIPRMGRYMHRYHGLTNEATQRLLDQAVEDNLIKLENKIGTKGTKSGVEERAYRLPTNDMLAREQHDWYCFHCHTGGEVVLCSDCHRVYHEACLKEPVKPALESLTEQEFLCSYCKAFQAIAGGGAESTMSKRDRRDLNHLLNLTCRKLLSKMPADLLYREAPERAAQKAQDLLDASDMRKENQKSEHSKTQVNGEGGTDIGSGGEAGSQAGKRPKSWKNVNKNDDENDDSWRINFLLKLRMDFDEIAAKCNSNQYRIVDEFRADCQLIVHNVVIFHGVHSNMADLARQMFRDCTYDLKDITMCRDCYRYANERQEKYWFCKPCRPFHELVYAKQKGFPYWPAKVMRVLEGGQNYDVRFFGGYHQRALVEKSHIRPISVNIHTLQVKRTSLWNKACEELRKHQEFIVKVQQNPDFLKEPFGDPFAAEDLKAQLGAGEDSEDSDSEDDAMNNQDDFDATPSATKGRKQQHQNSLPFYSDGEDEDTDGEDVNGSEKSQKLDLKKQKSQKSSSLKSPAFGTPKQIATNGVSLQQNQVLATATKTAPPPLPSGMTSAQLVQSTMISPPVSGTNKSKKDERSSKDKKLSKKKQKEIQQKQKMLLAEAAAKANATIVGTPTINSGINGGKLGDDGSSKKKRGRPKKTTTGEELGENVSSLKSPIAASKQSLRSSIASTSPQLASQQPAYISNGMLPHPSSVGGNSALQVQTEENLVSSSSPNFYESEPKVVCVAVQTPNKLLKSLISSKPDKNAKVNKEHDAQVAAQAKKEAEKEFKQFTEKTRADFDQEKKRAVNVATRSLERDLERLKADHATEMEELLEKNREELSAIKKKQWCYNCEAEAIYWCCWNTAYCSIECQQDHWHKEHKRACRRKR